LRADKKDKKHEEILWQFITGTDELLSDEVDDQIVLDLTANLEDGVRKAAEGCARILGLPKPTRHDIEEALDVISGYTVTTKKPTRTKDGKSPTPRYFGLLPEVNLEKLIDEVLKSQPNLPEDCKILWAEMKAQGRVTKRPHVTITHQKYAGSEKELWDQCLALRHLDNPPNFKFKLGQIMWNERVMAVTVEDLEVDHDAAAGDGQDLAETLLSKIPKARLHITVGTRTAEIPAVEAMTMVQARRGNDREPSVILEGIQLKGSLRGLFS
jgi:tRNA ligase